MFSRFWRNGNGKGDSPIDEQLSSPMESPKVAVSSEISVDLAAEQIPVEHQLVKQEFSIDIEPPTLPIATDDPDAWYQQGNLYRNAGKLDVALACYNKTIELQPHKQEAWANLGWVLVGLGRLPDALEAYRQAIKADPTFFEASYNLAVVSRDTGDLGAALVAYEQALAVMPESVNARFNFAFTLQEFFDRVTAFGDGFVHL